MLRSLRRIPLPLLIAQFGLIAVSLFHAVRILRLDLDNPQVDRSDSAVVTLLAGSWLATSLLTIVGLRWLMRTTVGVTRRGVEFASASAMLAVAVNLTGIVMSVRDVLTQGDFDHWKIQAPLWTAVALLQAVGLGVAARRWYWILLAVVVSFLAHPLSAVSGSLQDILGWRMWFVLGTLLRALDAAVVLLLLTRIVESSSDEGQQPSSGMQRLGASLWLLAGARIALVAFVALLDASADVWGDGAVAYRVGVVASTAVEMGALIWFGYALLEVARNRSDYPRWLLVVSTTAAWCVAGRTLMRVTEFVPRYFQQYFERRDSMRFSGLVGTGSEPLLIPALSAQTLMAIALGSVLVAIAIGAARQANESVRTRTAVALASFAALSIGGLTVQRLIADTPDLTPVGAVILIGGNAAVVAGVAIVALVVRRTIRDTATLPMARLHGGRSVG